MNSNINTVSVSVSPSGRTLTASVSQGILLDIVENDVPIGFTMSSNQGPVRWLNRRSLGVTKGNILLQAGFYTVAKTGHYKGEPFWRNIGFPKQGGYEHDREVMFHFIPQCRYEWEICSPDGIEDETWGDCLNFPKMPDDAVGKWLIRIPDGAFLRVKTSEFGSMCILNVEGKLTTHQGVNPNPNTFDKAIDAAWKRRDFLVEGAGNFQELVQTNILGDLSFDEPATPVVQPELTAVETLSATTPVTAPAEEVKAKPARRKKPALKDVKDLAMA